MAKIEIIKGSDRINVIKFLGGKPSPKQKETVEILCNSIDVIDRPSISKLSLNDSVFVICDTLYNRSSYSPILISNVPSKEEKAEEFYRKKDPTAKIPFPILNTITAESFLRSIFPELSRIVDSKPPYIRGILINCLFCRQYLIADSTVQSHG